MESFNLKLVKLDEEAPNELIKGVVALSHEPSGLLFGHYAALEDLRGLKIGKEENHDFAFCARDFDEIDMVVASVVRDLVEVSIQDMALLWDSFFVISNLHGRGSLRGHEVETASRMGLPLSLGTHLRGLCCRLTLLSGL